MSNYQDVYTVVEGVVEGKNRWVKIGRLVPHKNGDGGFNVYLDALPFNKTLVTRPHKDLKDVK